MEITLKVFFSFFFSGVGVGVALVSFMIQNKVVVRTFSELYVEIKGEKKRVLVLFFLVKSLKNVVFFFFLL